MKSFIAALITLTLLCTAVTVNCVFVRKDLYELCEMCRTMPKDAADADASEIRKKWDGCSRFISISVDHRETDSADDALSLLEASIERGDGERYAELLTKLYGIFSRMYTAEGISIDGIL